MADRLIEDRVQVDQKNEVILVPLYNVMVPFKVSIVKHVSRHVESNGKYSYIRVIFDVSDVPKPVENESCLKHLCFRTEDIKHAGEVVKLFNTLKSKVVSRESEKAKRSTLVSQDRLVVAGNKFKPIKLINLWIRPSFGGRGRKLQGSLEAHQNGFRYSTSRADERVDILFSNVKHAFFQPAEKEMITLVHFHLYDHIMVGNKKTKDVQFYVEVMDTVQTLGGRNRSAYDRDEIEEEQRERDRKRRINVDFKNFVNRVKNVKFDQPLRELGFHGVPHKASVFIVPTLTCMVELIETPFLVVSLSEIEIVNLERVGLGQKNFDMAIVFKDYKRDVIRIDSIPSTSLDDIKKWLTIAEIKYYESRLNMKWQAILKTIKDDPQQFIDEGGWEFLNLEGGDSDSEGSEESDQVYAPSDIETNSEDDDSGSASDEIEAEDDDDDDDDTGSESEDEDEEEEERSEEKSHACHGSSARKRPKLM